ncbi:MAG: sigma-70 family RNA polymerase sigma factor [Bacteroidota bacterium]|mgnify:CR=1 FL=1
MLRLFHKREKPTDQELIARFRASGNLEDLGILYEQYMALVYGVCLKILQDQGAAEDAVIGIFEELSRKLPKHEVSNFKSWLHSLTRNYCLMQLRRQKKDLTQSYDPTLMYLLDSKHPVNEQSEEGIPKSILKGCLDKLTPQQKQCIEGFYYSDMSYKEIAEEQNEEVGKIRSHIQNGRRNLRKCIEKTHEVTKGK